MQSHSSLFFFFNDTATTEIYTLSLHDALPISLENLCYIVRTHQYYQYPFVYLIFGSYFIELKKKFRRSEEHTSELQSLTNLVCRLLLEKKKNKKLNRLYLTFDGNSAFLSSI